MRRAAAAGGMKDNQPQSQTHPGSV